METRKMCRPNVVSALPVCYHSSKEQCCSTSSAQEPQAERVKSRPQWQDPLDFSRARILCLITVCWQPEIILNQRHHYFSVSSAVCFEQFPLFSLGITLEEEELSKEELSRGFNAEYYIAQLVSAGKCFCKLRVWYSR